MLPRLSDRLRVQQRISLPTRVSVDVMAEAFNVFNRPNWTITTQEQSPQYLQRTSGENRLSNFMLWQAAYAELVFTDILWPDVDRLALWKAIDIYARRDRRFGKA